MRKIDNSGPAFPTNNSIQGVWSTGMTLRDYFAAQALAGLAGRRFHAGDSGEGYAEWAASMAYEFADAMLATRGAQ